MNYFGNNKVIMTCRGTTELICMDMDGRTHVRVSARHRFLRYKRRVGEMNYLALPISIWNGGGGGSSNNTKYNTN